MTRLVSSGGGAQKEAESASAGQSGNENPNGVKTTTPAPLGRRENIAQSRG